MESILDIVIRIFAGCLLAFFAFAPGYISYIIILGIITEPTDTEWVIYLVLAVTLSLFYFLCLLTYRAFTGRGRKEDGGLLPPWALKLFAGVFGVIAIIMIIMGMYQGNLLGSMVGVGYLSTALLVHGIAKWREKQFNLKA